MLEMATGSNHLHAELVPAIDNATDGTGFRRPTAWGTTLSWRDGLFVGTHSEYLLRIGKQSAF